MEINNLSLVSPHPSKCQYCAVEHKPDQPHNAQSMHYAFWFQKKYGRSPTWADAMDHCSQETKAKFAKYLLKLRVDINSKNLTGDLKSKEEVEFRLNPKKTIEKLNNLIQK